MLRGAALQISGRRNRRMKNASVLSLATSAAVRRTLSSPDSISSNANSPATCPPASARKAPRVRDLARRDAMGLLGEVVAPRPYTVARRQVVRGKIDLHRRHSDPPANNFTPSACVKRVTRPRVDAAFSGSRSVAAWPHRLSAASLSAFWLWRSSWLPQSSVEGDRNILLKSVPTASTAEVRSALNETSRGVR